MLLKVNEADKKIKMNSLPPKSLINRSEKTRVLTENMQGQNQKSDEETLDWTKNLTKIEKNSFLTELTSNYERFKKTHKAKKPASIPPTRPSSQHPHSFPPQANHVNLTHIPPSTAPSVLPHLIKHPIHSSVRPSSSSIIPDPSSSEPPPCSLYPNMPLMESNIPLSPSKTPVASSSTYEEDDVERSVEKQFSKVDNILDAILKAGEENKRPKSEMKNKLEKENV